MSLKITAPIDDETIESLDNDTVATTTRQGSADRLPQPKKIQPLSKSQYRRLVEQGVIPREESNG